MFAKIKYTILLLGAQAFLAFDLLASGESHGEHLVPSVMDLKWPAINFSILFIFILVKIKKPLKSFFDQNKIDVESLFKHAAEKDKDAQMKLDMYREKLKHLPDHSKKMNEEAKTDLLKFEHDLKEQTYAQVEKIKKENKNRTENEKKLLLNKLGAELFDQVVTKAKDKISKDANLKTSISKNLIQKAK